MVFIQKEEWFNVWRKEFFELGQKGILFFIEENEPLNKEILDFFSKESEIPILVMDARKFKFLRRVLRKHFDLNGFPSIGSVNCNKFSDYEYLRNYYRTHPGRMTECLECFVEKLKEED